MNKDTSCVHLLEIDENTMTTAYTTYTHGVVVTQDHQGEQGCWSFIGKCSGCGGNPRRVIKLRHLIGWNGRPIRANLKALKSIWCSINVASFEFISTWLRIFERWTACETRISSCIRIFAWTISPRSWPVSRCRYFSTLSRLGISVRSDGFVRVVGHIPSIWSTFRHALWFISRWYTRQGFSILSHWLLWDECKSEGATELVTARNPN